MTGRSPVAAPSLVMLLIGWLFLGAGLIADALRGSPEHTLRTYLADLEARRTSAALAAMTPDAAARWRDFVDFQQFNRYRVVSVAVRSPSLVDSIGQGTAWQATQATLVADVTEPSGIRWRGGTIVPVERRNGRWLIQKPPFAP